MPFAVLVGIVLAAVLVVAAVLVAVLVPGYRVTGHAAPYCDDITVDFKTDDAMRTAERELRTDPRVRELTAHTKQENYALVKEIFANQPELLENVRPEAVPASLQVVEQVGVDPRSFADELERYGKVKYTDVCALRKTAGGSRW